MEIVGRGFIAHHVTRLAGRHPGVTVIAAGVSTTAVTSVAEFDREAALVYHVLRRCRRSGRLVVFLSTASAAMYGDRDSPGTEAGPVYPTSSYGRHKLSLEAVVASAGVDALVLRLSHVVGHAQRSHQLLPLLVAGVRSGLVTVHRDSTRDLVDVDHLVTSLDRLLANRVRAQVVNIASGAPEPVEHIVAGIERRLGTVAARQLGDTPPTHAVVSNARLRALVPEADGFGFGPGYLDALLDRYVGPRPAVLAGR